MSLLVFVLWHQLYFFTALTSVLFNLFSKLTWNMCRRQALEKLRVSHPPVFQLNLSWNHLTTRENFTHILAQTKSAVRCDRTSCSCSEALRSVWEKKQQQKKHAGQKRMCFMPNRELWEERWWWNELTRRVCFSTNVMSCSQHRGSGLVPADTCCTHNAINSYF